MDVSISETPVDYQRALMEAGRYLDRRQAEARGQDLCALLADWASEGEELLYPMPALDPTRR